MASTDTVLTTLRLGERWRSARHALTSVPWPAERDDVPAARGVAHQVVRLFEPALPPRLRRFLLLTHAEQALPESIELIPGGAERDEAQPFSSVTVRTVAENTARTAGSYIYREDEAQIEVAGHRVGVRMGLKPRTCADPHDIGNYSWWQWCRAERVWSGALAEAWRIGGHLTPYTIREAGHWQFKDQSLLSMAESIRRHCGDVLHGELFVIVWRDGLVQVHAHFRSTYFHDFPKPIPAFPVLLFRGTTRAGGDAEMSIGSGLTLDVGGAAVDLSPASLMFNEDHPARVTRTADGAVLQPWSDLRILGNKTKENQIAYLDPAEPDVLPAGVSRSLQMNVALGGDAGEVARYAVSPQWYKRCGVIESDHIGAATRMAQRTTSLITEHTHAGGIDTGRVWRYLRRDLRSGKPQEDGAEWEGNLGQAMFQLAYQTGGAPEDLWQLHLQQAYHAADVSIYHGSWMGRLEASTALTCPLPKFRVGAFVTAYLETGDPHLLELARGVLGVYMVNEWTLQPRASIGRDIYPIAAMMHLWDYSADAMYLDFARQASQRLFDSQDDDGGFSGQAGAGVFTGVAAMHGPGGIHFGACIAPIAVMEWAVRDPRSRNLPEFRRRLARWVDLVLAMQNESGQWCQASGQPYHLTGSTMLCSLLYAGRILGDDRCAAAVAAFLRDMDATGQFVSGTHSFLSALYAHVADGASPT